MSKCECEDITHTCSTFSTRDGSPNHRYGCLFNSEDLKPVKTIWGTFNVCAKCDRECYGSEVQGRLIKENEVQESAGSQGD